MIKFRNFISKNLKKIIYIGKQVVSSIFPKPNQDIQRNISDLYECQKVN